jgi:hypothetical protein
MSHHIQDKQRVKVHKKYLRQGLLSNLSMF